MPLFHFSNEGKKHERFHWSLALLIHYLVSSAKLSCSSEVTLKLKYWVRNKKLLPYLNNEKQGDLVIKLITENCLLIQYSSLYATAPTWKCCHSKNRKRYINKIKTILLFLLVWKAGLVRHWLKNWLLIFDCLSYLIMEKHFYFLLQFIYYTT